MNKNNTAAALPVIRFAFLFRILPNVAQSCVFLDEAYNRDNSPHGPSTREISRAHLWKTRAGGERWIAARASQKFNNSQIVQVRVHPNGFREVFQHLSSVKF